MSESNAIDREPEVATLEPVPDAGFRDLDPNGVLEQPFWERYNKHLEMPLGWSLSVLAFVAAIAVMVFVQQLSRSKDGKPVPISALDGDDAVGTGSPGSGGEDAPIALGQPPTKDDVARIARDLPEQDLKDVKDQLKFDTNGTIEVPDSAALPLASLDKQIRDKLLGTKRGDGKPGTGGDGGGNGPGGYGADATRARGLRWVLNFDTRTGRDYLNQLHAMKAVVMVPTADGQKMYIFKDLQHPKPGPVATDADLDALSNQIQFSDITRRAVDAVCDELGIRGYTPNMFMAFFPKDLEKKMADLEVAYRNKRPEDIRQTKFKVLMRGGAFDLIVTDQQYK
jgi:hypothetical protein